MSHQNEYWLSGSKDSEVRRYLHGKPDLHGLMMNAAGACIRAIAVDPAGKRVAIATECARSYSTLFDCLQLSVRQQLRLWN